MTERRKSTLDINGGLLGTLNDRRIKEGIRTGDLDTMKFRVSSENKNPDDPAELVRQIRNRLAGASAPNLCNWFPGVTAKRAIEAMDLSRAPNSELDDSNSPRLSVAELKLVASATDSHRLAQMACRLGGLETPNGGILSLSPRHMDGLNAKKIDVMNTMQDPTYLVAPVVSMEYLYTKFLPKIMNVCGGGERMPILRDGILEYFKEQDAKFRLTDKAEKWFVTFVDMMAYSGGSEGSLDDLIDNYPKSDIGKVARIVNPIQYAMMIAIEIIKTYLQEGSDEVFFDRYASTLLGTFDGKLITEKGQALAGCWEAGDEVPALRMMSTEGHQAGRLIFRPSVSSIA